MERCSPDNAGDTPPALLTTSLPFAARDGGTREPGSHASASGQGQYLPLCERCEWVVYFNTHSNKIEYLLETFEEERMRSSRTERADSAWGQGWIYCDEPIFRDH